MGNFNSCCQDDDPEEYYFSGSESEDSDHEDFILTVIELKTSMQETPSEDLSSPEQQQELTYFELSTLD